MKWLLVLWLTTGEVLVVHEFDTEGSCRNARYDIVSSSGLSGFQGVGCLEMTDGR